MSPRADFVTAMRAAVAGVHVVTTAGPGGRFGLTVSSVSSVSADPPTLLACIASRSPLVAAIGANGVFAVNTLSAAQAGIADTFAGRPSRGVPYDFGSTDWEAGETGAPLLARAAAWFECRLATSVGAGSHAVLIGDVTRAQGSDRTGLAYTRRAYARPVRLLGVGSPAQPHLLDERPRRAVVG